MIHVSDDGMAVREYYRANSASVLVATNRPIGVSLQRSSGGPAVDEAKLLDISAAATKLSIATPCPVDEEVRIRLRVDELKIDRTYSAHSCWLKYDDGNDWHADFSFEQPLDGRFSTRCLTPVISNVVKTSDSRHRYRSLYVPYPVKNEKKSAR